MTATSVRNGLNSDYASFFKEKKKAKPKKIWGIEDALAANTVKGQMERPRKIIGLRKTRLRNASPKMQRRLVEYRRVKAIWWAARMEIDGGRCQFVNGESRCLCRAMEQPHHINGRGKSLSEPGTFLAVCFQHHDWIENNKREARERGWITYK